MLIILNILSPCWGIKAPLMLWIACGRSPSPLLTWLDHIKASLESRSCFGRITDDREKIREDKDVEFKTTLMYSLNLLPGAISELLATVKDTHCITKADRYGLMAAILDESLSDEDRFSLDRLLRSLCRGRVQVVDELSMIL